MTPRIVVVGGGISGLAAAFALADGSARVTVLEGSGRLGGKLYGGELAGVSVDLGAESVLARRPEAVDLIRAVGLADQLTHPVTTSAGLWIGDRILPLPPTVMGVPADPVAARDVLGCDVARVEAGLAAPELTEDVAIGRFVAKRMGRPVTDRLVDPLLGGVYAGRADELSLAAAVPELFAKLRTAPSLLSAATELRRAGEARAGQPVFTGIRGGVHRLAEALVGVLEKAGVEIRTRCTVRSVARTAAGFGLETGPVPAPAYERADAVVLATPAPATGRMLAGLLPAASSELAGIDYASLAIVTLAVRRSDWPAGAAGSGFLVPAVERRTIKAATYSHAKWDWPGGDLAVFRTSIGRLGEEATLQRPDSELVAAAVADLGAAIGLRGPVLASTVTRWGGALPQYRVGHLDRVSRIESAVDGVPGLAVCGAAYRGIGIAACVSSATRAAARVREHLATLSE